MLGNTFGLPHLIIILVIILLLFGAPKLPGLARSVGQSMKIFRNEVKTEKKPDADDSTDATPDGAAAKQSKTEL
ncbi:twin-arginine translocase TatA/TatE family subunit [Glaciihabitans arcticus]|uniref:Sec-independent protein translocase protein TatA n=1 Tax=Glaciihabitans arcticus TaxID=2668039 RepID=A0A4Q9GP54_9MICO|nr:twin-arginine translocase TatA/TatE family subunit [Glaciihabitans arcticus]TBN56602.1 twin-arginine translocase TatA/TatE family subunit [Glaciihabitans arcticus]